LTLGVVGEAAFAGAAGFVEASGAEVALLTK
jgi:hypothetical protein